MRRLAVFLLLCGVAATPSLAAPAVIVNEKDVVREEAPPHGAIGMSTVFRLADQVPGRTMDFRKRILHVGAAIGLHPIDHDEVYYVLSGTGVASSAGKETAVTAGTAIYFYHGDQVGIRQSGKVPLTLIISYPLPKP